MRHPLRRVSALALLVFMLAALPVSNAQADGDPGSDVLVFQNLFVGSDAGLSVAQQADFGNLLQAAGRAHFPIRVAIVASPTDLGAVTELWRQPRSYARFLGLELSLAYKGRLLVVMPNGFGFNWPGHSSASEYRLLDKIAIHPGGGLVGAAQQAVRTLAAASSVNLGSAAQSASTSASSRSGGGSAPPPAGRSTDNLAAIIAAAIAAIAVALLGVRVGLRRRRAARPVPSGSAAQRLGRPIRARWAVRGFAVVLAVAAVGVVVAVGLLGSSGVSQSEALASNPNVDPGTPLARTAPDFTLSDQFGQPVSLRSYRGKVVLLAFTDSECTTICPMTSTAMLDAKAMLGPAGSKVQLLGVDANPASTSLEDVWSYSELHGLLHQWRFLTGPLQQLRSVWRSYSVEADIQRGLIAHTPALFLIDPQGREAKVYVTQQSYAAVGQLGQVLAHDVSRLLPGHPRVRSDLSYAPIHTISPASAVALPRAGGGTVHLGPGPSPHLYVFFATWDQEITSLGGELDALNGYAAQAARAGLPPLTAVDEGSVEPSATAISSFLARLPHPLSYPVAIDQSGRVADGYQVLGVPWLVLTSATGRILWYREVSTSGWPPESVLVHAVRSALARAPSAPTSAGAVARELAGSPPPLALLHQQSSTLLGPESGLTARIRALRGYPIVVNAWASWCTPCQAEFGLFASASARYGSRVAFLGADANDSAGDARSFLAQHRVSYPSYQATTSALQSLAPIEGLPTTIFIDRAGKVVWSHAGQYDSQAALDGDISSYAR